MTPQTYASIEKSWEDVLTSLSWPRLSCSSYCDSNFGSSSCRVVPVELSGDAINVPALDLKPCGPSLRLSGGMPRALLPRMLPTYFPAMMAPCSISTLSDSFIFACDETIKEKCFRSYMQLNFVFVANQRTCCAIKNTSASISKLPTCE